MTPARPAALRSALARAAPALAAALLAGCSTTPPPGPAAEWTSGRLNVQVAASAERRGQNLAASFELRGGSDAGELRLMSPLGTQMAAARWAPGRAELQTSEGTRAFTSLDELSREALGEALPLAALPSWIAGRPWPQLPHQPLAEGFEQTGWQVLLARQGEGVIEARRGAPPAVLLRVRLDTAP